MIKAPSHQTKTDHWFKQKNAPQKVGQLRNFSTFPTKSYQEAEDPWSKMCGTGRLEAVEKKEGHPGPGDYELPDLPGETETKW